ncbi:transcriptional repressor of the glutamine synthetase gene [Streptococcus pneumoniae]|nr:transcriptional repressor of the glutamine synthetase gene [Streptococcus pneumoniae]
MTWIVCLKSKIISLKVIISLPLRKKYAEREAKSKKAVSQTEVRRALHNELLQQGRFASVQSPFGRG